MTTGDSGRLPAVVAQEVASAAFGAVAAVLDGKAAA